MVATKTESSPPIVRAHSTFDQNRWGSRQTPNQFGRAVIFRVANNSHLAAKLANQLSLRHIISRIVSPLSMNVGSERTQDALNRLIVKDNNVMHADQRCDDSDARTGPATPGRPAPRPRTTARLKRERRASQRSLSLKPTCKRGPAALKRAPEPCREWADRPSGLFVVVSPGPRRSEADGSGWSFNADVMAISAPVNSASRPRAMTSPLFARGRPRRDCGRGRG